MFKPICLTSSLVSKVFYDVRRGHVQDVYLFWKKARSHAVGILSDLHRFKSLQKAEAFVDSAVSLGQPPHPFPAVTIFPDGSA